MKQPHISNFVRKWSLLLSRGTISYPSNEYKAVFETLLIGSFILIVVVSALLFISYFSLHNTRVALRMIWCALGLIYLAVTYRIWIRGKFGLASRLLIGFYLFIATVVHLLGGLNVPFGLLIFAIGIILSGILLGARHSLYTSGLVILLIFGIQTFLTLNGAPPFVVMTTMSNFGDATAYSTLLTILGLISWLFGRQNEHLFARRIQAEQELIKEKELLEVRVRERTYELRKAQLAEIEQLYQFAEIGQVSTALLHDLANHLSVINFDIADLKKQQQTGPIQHVEDSIAYLEQAVNQVRQQLQGKNEYHRFSAAACLKDTIKLIKPKAAEAGVTIKFEATDPAPSLYGDPLRLSHIVTILIQNAIDAYKTVDATSRRVIQVALDQTKTTVTIRVRDYGSGIVTAAREQLFVPLRSSKKDGLGIGLFIARKITETHFKGTLVLAAPTDYTEFVITLPKINAAS